MNGIFFVCFQNKVCCFLHGCSFCDPLAWCFSFNGAKVYFEQDWFFVSEAPRSEASVASLIKQQQQQQELNQQSPHHHRQPQQQQQQQLPKQSSRRAGSSPRYSGSEDDAQASALFQSESLKYKKTPIQLTTLPYASTDAEPGQSALGASTNLTISQERTPSLISSPKSNFGAATPAAAVKKPAGATSSDNPQGDFKVSNLGVWELKVRVAVF